MTTGRSITGGFHLRDGNQMITSWSGRSGRGFWSFDTAGWALLALGAALSYGAINFTVIQPARKQMAQLEEQVASLDASVRSLTGRRGAVAATNTLLSQLNDQG